MKTSHSEAKKSLLHYTLNAQRRLPVTVYCSPVD